MLPKLLARLPISVLYGISSVLYVLAYYVIRPRRKLVFEHLRQAFPEWDETQVRLAGKAFFRNILDVFMEIIASSRMSPEALTQRMEFSNLDIVNEHLEQGQSMVFLSAHFSNWEWLLLSASINIPIPVDVVYKPLHSESADDFMYTSRSRFGVDPISMKDFANEVIRRKSQQRVFCILADQKPPRDSKALVTRFLNRETRFFLGPEKIAQFAKIPVFFIRTERLARGRYKAELVPLGAPPYQKQRDSHPMTERYVREVEAMIHNQPESYLWGHKRWKGQSVSVGVAREPAPEKSAQP